MKYYIKRETASLKRETAYLLLEFNKADTEKESLFWKEWDEKIKEIERTYTQSIGNEQKEGENVTQYWRRNNSIPSDLYSFLRWNYPVPIPDILFFPFNLEKEFNYKSEYVKDIGHYADKWLKDILSKRSFYKQNKEYFTRNEVKYFLSCDWDSPECHHIDLIAYFFDTKINANDLNLSLDIFYYFRDCFAHHIVIEYFKFLCNNKKYINNEEIKEINKFLKNEYILTRKNIDFKNQTYKRLYDEGHFSNMLRDRFKHRYEHKIVQDYLTFICKNIKRVRGKEEEIRDICDFLDSKINNEQDFIFENMTWRELKQLSDEWHFENRLVRGPYSRNYLNAKWKKSSIKNFSYEKDGKTWTIKEITTWKLLCKESEDMDHCVYSYADHCIQGNCFIFSVSYKSEEDDNKKKIATVEISRGKKLIQARGPCNVSINNETADIIKIWADKNGIDCGNYLNNRRQIYGYVA